MLSADQSPSYWQLVRQNPQFRRLWLGDVASFFGDWFNMVALYTAVQEISSSAQAVAAVMVAKTLPPFLVTPLGGPVVDRFSRRKVLLWCDFLRAGVAMGLVASYAMHSLVGLYACTVVMTALSGISFPAKQAAIPQVAPPAHVPAANALSAGTWSVMLAFGATAGGVLTAWLGVSAALLFDAVTYLVSALFFVRLPPLLPKARDGQRAGFVDGLRYMVSNGYTLVLTATKPLMGLLGGVLVLIPFWAGGTFAGASGPIFLGLLYSVRGLGALTGSLSWRRVFGDSVAVMRWTIFLGFAIAFVSYGLLSQALQFWQAAVAYFCAAVGTGGLWVATSSLMQLETDPRFHGRLFSIEFGTMTLMMAASSWASGAALDAGFTLREVTLVAACTAAPSAVIWSFVNLRGLKPPAVTGSG